MSTPEFWALFGALFLNAAVNTTDEPLAPALLMTALVWFVVAFVWRIA